MSTNLNLESVLVVGATGQVGSNVVRKLVQKGKKVRALVRQEGKTIHGLDEGVEYVVGDLSNRVSLEKSCPGYGGCRIHCKCCHPRQGTFECQRNS